MRISCLVLAILFHTILSASAQLSLKKVLVFSKTMRYHHESIPAGIAAIEKLGKENGFMVDTSTNSSSFNTSNLKQYKAVIFLSTTGNVLDTIQKVAFQNFIRSGGGFVGIHSASSTEKSWQWYGKLLGAVFTDHPEPQNGTVWVKSKSHPITKALPATWERMDEWYNFEQIPKGVHVLLLADERTFKGGKHGKYHPVAWYQEFDGGRSFYTALGHFADSYTDPLYLSHLLGGIEYSMGK